MNVQHINVKVFAEPSAVDLAAAIPVFHHWIQQSGTEPGAGQELLIDVADYRHVPGGPGVMLIGHEANYSLDWGPENRLGLLYNRKAPMEGTTQDKLLQSFHAALDACRRLQEEPAFSGNLRFDAGSCDVILNDRLLTPNTEETWLALKPEFEAFFESLFGHKKYLLHRGCQPRERFRVRVEAAEPIGVGALLAQG
jgi:hypothetical protein